MSIILANKSPNFHEYIAQLHRLSTLTSDYSLNDEDTKAFSINITEDFLLKGLKLPGKYKGKLSVNPLTPFVGSLKDDIKEYSLNFINKEVSDDDVILNAYLSKYDIANSYAVLWDVSNKSNINIKLFYTLITLTMKDTANVNIFLYSSSKTKSKFNISDISAANENIKYNIINELPFNLIVKLMLHSNMHINTGSLASTFICKLVNVKITDSVKNVICSVPLLDNSTPDNGWKCINCTRESTPYFDRIYYINLAHRTDRREHMENQLLKLGLSAGRVNAFNGKELKWDISFGIASKFWNTGAVAYCLSYQNAIIDAIKNDYDRILILDDDAVLASNFYEVLESAFKSLPEDWHLLYLGANHSTESAPTEETCISDSLYKLKGSVGSHAIIINKPAFNMILNFASTPYGPLDVFLSIYQQICPAYITYPGLASQLPGHSDIIDSNVDYNKDWGIDYINHVPYRNIKTQVDSSSEKLLTEST